MPGVHPEVRDLVARRVSRGGWALSQMYAECRGICSTVEGMSVEEFRQEVVVPIIQGKEPKGRKTSKLSAGTPEGFSYRLARRIEQMEKEQEQDEEHVHECPIETCIGGSSTRAGLARHIDGSHPEQAEELRRQVGLDPKGGSKKQAKPSIPAGEIEAIREEISRMADNLPLASPPKVVVPEKGMVRGLLIDFAKEVRDSTDPLDVAEQLETYTNLLYEMFIETTNNEEES